MMIVVAKDPGRKNLETDERFPSGPWVGFWLQKPLTGRQWMRDLWLEFVDGKIAGGGRDWVGPFHCRGSYDLKSGGVTIYKDYVDAHTVEYRGQNQNDGQWLWGVWHLPSIGERGGFHLWPKGAKDPTQHELKAEAEPPVRARVKLGV